MAEQYVKSPLENGELDSPEYSPTNSPEIVIGIEEEHSDHEHSTSPRYIYSSSLYPDIPYYNSP